MPTPFQFPTTYFLREGRENLRECIKLSCDAALSHGIKKLVIFTAAGEGPRIAIQEFLSLQEYSKLNIVAVTFPAGRIPASISPADRELFQSSGVPLVQTHLPFDPIHGTFGERGEGQGLSLLGSALEIFCGSMNLCVQAALVACDAGVVEPGEHVIVLTSDTSILVRACPTCHFLRNFVVREIFCKPAILSISKQEALAGESKPNAEIVVDQTEAKELNEGQSS